MEITTLQTLIDWIIRLGAAYAGFELTARLNWPADAELRRYTSFIVAAVIGLVAWLIGIEFGYIAQPAADWHKWVEGGAGVVLPIIIGAQIAHARVVLSKQAARAADVINARG